jgi:hypothetical protein
VCEVNWNMILEFLKIVLSGPPMALVIALLILGLFHFEIRGFLSRLVEGNVLGQSFRASPPFERQPDRAPPEDDPLKKAAEVRSSDPVKLPPELESDPQARAAIDFVRSNPVQTVIEYKRLLTHLNWERVFNLIYGTQVQLLSFLAGRPSEGATMQELSSFHAQHQKEVGNTSYQLRDYLNFLRNFGLVDVEGPSDAMRFRISQYGLEFLSYIKSAYVEAWNRRSY